MRRYGRAGREGVVSWQGYKKGRNSSLCLGCWQGVFDGVDDHSKSLGRYCTSSPSHLVSSTNHVFVKFVSDISFSGRGFHLKYYTECNVTTRDRYGVLESHNYPQEYSAMLNCMWVLMAPQGSKYNITFAHFDLEDGIIQHELSVDHRDCRYDYIENTRLERLSTAFIWAHCSDDSRCSLLKSEYTIKVDDTRKSP
ncbi:hypothetical protein J6590_068225 [Homalodisca vitripennis]|nr:hypothetical protein J6590_068225 [Homalodisca vitripennis]